MIGCRAAALVLCLVGCSAGRPATRAPSAASAAEPIPELAVGEPMGMAKCAPPQGGRTWVGFSERFELADFGEAAGRAEALIALLKTTACTPQLEADPQGVLAASLAAHAMWIARVIFVTPALDRAEVSVERVGGTGNALVLGFALEQPPPDAPPDALGRWRFTSITQR